MWEQVANPALLYGSEVVAVNETFNRALTLVGMDVGRCVLGSLERSAD